MVFSSQNEINSKTLRIDGTTRKNSKASIGQEVTVQKLKQKKLKNKISTIRRSHKS